MTVRYHTRADSTIVPDYVCQNDGISNAAPICQHLPGTVLDTAIAGLLLATLTPLALEVALTVTDELAAQAGHADALRATHVQRAQHAADQARRRYLAVDPGNRLVADALEADWNARLRELAAARDDYAAARTATAVPDERQRARIRAMAADFPALWHDPATPMRERKRLEELVARDEELLGFLGQRHGSVRAGQQSGRGHADLHRRQESVGVAHQPGYRGTSAAALAHRPDLAVAQCHKGDLAGHEDRLYEDQPQHDADVDQSGAHRRAELLGGIGRTTRSDWRRPPADGPVVPPQASIDSV